MYNKLHNASELIITVIIFSVKLTLWTAGAENQVILEAHKQQDQEVSSRSRLHPRLQKEGFASSAEITPYDSEDELDYFPDVFQHSKRLVKRQLSREGQS